MNQIEKANHFASLHIAGSPLVLYNIWDAGSAKTITDSGAAAVATGSWSVAAAHGFDDGEKIPMSLLFEVVRRIAESVDVPLSVDFEGGYSTDPDAAAENIRQLIATGAIGINIEDQIVGGQGLHSIVDQANRIRAIRKAAEQANVPLFINSRTDLFLKSDATQHQGHVDEALERATAYAEAGASGFFVPGLTQSALIERVCLNTGLPVNVMMRGELKKISDVAPLGVSRASFGPGPYIEAMSDLAGKFKALN
ncbi:MAG: isocitrate lyase/phosphoenolpyruvate mutase family protein [Granulosicoccus sp.]